VPLVTGADALTVSVAAAVVALPTLFVKTARYSEPLSPVLVAPSV
jgi:hypothetical protein